MLPPKALVQSFEVTFTAGWILWVFPRVGQRHEDHPPLEGPEGSPVDASETEQEGMAQEGMEQEGMEQEASSLVRGKLRQPPAPEKTTMLPSLRGYSEKKKPP